MKVDAHTHLLPDRLARKIRAYFDERVPGAMAYPLQPEAVLDSHAEAGITTVWNLPYAHKPGMSARLNESMADLELALTGRGVDIVTGCTVHVADDDPAELLRRAVKDLEAGVCKLHCSVGDYSPDDSRFGEFWEVVGELEVPVIVHAGHATDGHTEASELAPIDAVANAHPDARIVIAHCGHQAYLEALELLAKHPNVYADLTPVGDSVVPLSTELCQEFQSKLMFGTDAPNARLTAAQLLKELPADLGAEATDAILSGTARSLIP